MNSLREAKCGNKPSNDLCYEADCPNRKDCEALQTSSLRYPAVRPRHQCQYINTKGERCRRTAYYYVPIQDNKHEYRCITDCPIGMRRPANKIRTHKDERP